MDLKSFQNSRSKQEHSDIKTKENDLRKTAESYAQKSDEELLGEILATASKGKRDGTITQEGLRNFAQSVAPMLNEEQRNRLQTVLDMINRS